jgi:hypothetical protein
MEGKELKNKTNKVINSISPIFSFGGLFIINLPFGFGGIENKILMD